MAQSYLDEENEESFDISNQLVPNVDAYNPLARYDLTQPYAVEEDVNLDENGVNDYLRPNEEVVDIPNLAKLAQAVNAGNLSKRALRDYPETPINPDGIQITELPPVFSKNALENINQDIATPIISKNTPKPVENNLNSDLKRESIKTKEELALDRQPVSEQSLDLSHIGQDLKMPESAPEKTTEQRYLELAQRLSDEAKNDTSLKDAEAERKKAFNAAMLARIFGKLGQAVASGVGGQTEGNESFAQAIMNNANEGLKIAQEKNASAAKNRAEQLKAFIDQIKEQRLQRKDDASLEMQKGHLDRLNKASDLQSRKFENELAQSEALNDPNSDISKNSRGLLSRLLKQPIGDNVSANQLKSAGFAGLVNNLGNRDLQERRLELDKQRLDSLDADRALRRQERQDKVDRKTSLGLEKDKATMLKNYRDYGPIKKLNEQRDAVDRVSTLLDEAKTNPASWPVIGTQAARAFGEVGNLTETDVGRFKGSQSYARKMKRWISEGKAGVPPLEDIKDLQALISVFKDKVESNRIGYAKSFAKSYNQIYGGKMPESDIMQILEPNYKDEKVKPSYPAGSVVKVKGKEYRVGADGDSLEEIK